MGRGLFIVAVSSAWLCSIEFNGRTVVYCEMKRNSKEVLEKSCSVDLYLLIRMES
jgi:hypothetical protein